MYSLSMLTALASTPAPPGEGEPLRLVRGEHPAPVRQDADRDDVIAVAVDRGEHRPAARAGDRVLRALPAAHHRHPDLASLVHAFPSFRAVPGQPGPSESSARRASAAAGAPGQPSDP